MFHCDDDKMTKVSLVNVFVGLVVLIIEILYKKVVFSLTSGHFDLQIRSHMYNRTYFILRVVKLLLS